MRKFLVLALMLLFTFSCAVIPGNKVYAHHDVTWSGMQVKLGQIGKVDVLKKTTIYKMKNKKLVSHKKADAKSVHRVFKIDKTKKLYSIGSGQYMKINAKELKYTAAPKSVLDKMKNKHIELTRGTYIGDSPKQVKKVEKAKWIADMKDLIVYDVKKYGYNTELMYAFEKKKLEVVFYDLELDKERHTFKEMKALHDSIVKRVQKDEKLKGKGAFETDNKTELYTVWTKGKTVIVVGVTNEEGYTEAIVAFGSE